MPSRRSVFKCALRTNSDCPQRQRRPLLSPCSRMKRGTGGPPTYLRPPAQGSPPCWEKSPMPDRGSAKLLAQIALAGTCALMGCGLSCSQRADPATLVMIIESSPTNLDPRVGTDGQSERIYELIFDALLRRDEHFNVQPGLAERWEAPDPLRYVFHLRRGVRFHDGRPLTSLDVKWTFDSLLQGKIPSTKNGTYKYVASV